MARTAALVDSLKRELRARSITYAAVAGRLGVSEASVKRMFSRKDFTLSRLDAVCELAGMEFSELARSLAAHDEVISHHFVKRSLPGAYIGESGLRGRR